LRFDRQDNRALRDWQFANLRLTWAVADEPWRFERDVIAALQPPLNVDFNDAHPFCATMKAARADCVANTRPLAP